MKLEGKVALVTGAARRVGRAIALHLAARGARVAIHYRASEREARELQAAIAAAGGTAAIFHADLASLVDVQRMVREVEGALGYVDVLVNNASEYFETPLATASDDDYDRLMDVHVRAPFRLARRIAPTMLNRGAGKIVNVVDVHAKAPLPSHLLYCVSKAALEMMTRCLALELAPTIQVNAVAPGVVLWPEDSTAEDRAKRLADVPLARAGSPEDVAHAVRFLVEDADYMTGQVLRVDGGRSL